ncbi:3-oxoacyl-[acyl-carrier-protein] synthase 2 [Maioricimonas rarisocia]|uniref:3-oxoacyl-[acyl-carrier-protein] synthase 2 n=1 Tax=Maioricimonas rarisocia TaxID=2528026 RepID=A0A517ZAB5_9PLAN|nr:beta-ketoacyl-[acyl-carrier-protein] synthase family protein [Maioricimonas rarisocia]QDU39432.1 3-oxoacyl-[acyl-carrier-protein] synthase 2 [Maioricimonas rarisocia]
MPQLADQTPGDAIVVTGIGMVTPLGGSRETGWQALVSGKRACRQLTPDELEERGWPDGSRGEWPGALAVFSPDERGNGRVVGMALQAAGEAVADAAWNPAGDTLAAERTGCVIGTSKGDFFAASRQFQDLTPSGTPDLAAADWLACWPHAAATAVAQQFDARGPLLCPVAACATGLVSLIRGADLIRNGACDVVIAGSSDAALHPALQACYRRMGVLARGDQPVESRCRPFDRDRSGFIAGEGAAILVLERRSHAEARGARIDAEWLGACMAADPAGITQLDPGADGLTYCIRSVLRQAGTTAESVDYVGLHGTATVPNDRSETRAIRQALGPVADSVRCSSLKGSIGHLLGAAGSVETAATVLAMRDSVAPPTVNLDTADPECDLDYTPGNAATGEIRTALKLSLGFGGHVAAVLLGQP